MPRRRRFHRPEPQLDAPRPRRAPSDAAVGEAAGGRGRDRVGEQDRVGDAVDGRSRRAASAPTTRREHRARAARGADADLGRGRVGVGPPSPAAAASAPPPLQRQAHRTSVPRPSPPEIAKLLESAAISERPSPQAGALDVGAGLMPAPLSLTVTVSPSASGTASTRAARAHPPGRRGRRRSCRPR